MSKASEKSDRALIGEEVASSISMRRVELAGIFADSFAEIRKGASITRGIGLANKDALSADEMATIEEIAEKLVEAANAMNYLIGLLDG